MADFFMADQLTSQVNFFLTKIDVKIIRIKFNFVLVS